MDNARWLSRGTINPACKGGVSNATKPSQEQPHQECTKDGRNADDIREECRTKKDQDDDGQKEHRRPVLDGAGLACKPVDQPSSNSKQCDSESQACQQDVERLNTATAVHKTDSEGQTVKTKLGL
jgi:hypothetical protein